MVDSFRTWWKASERGGQLQNVVQKYSQDVMEYSRNESGRGDEKTEILDIFHYLNGKLPYGCTVNEGHIQIEFLDRSCKTHGFRKKNQIHKKDTKDTMTKEHLLKICQVVHKLSNLSYKGWRCTRIIVRKDDRLYNILEGLARMERRSRNSRRMEDQKQGWTGEKPSKKVYNVSYTAPEVLVFHEENILHSENKEKLKESLNNLVYQEGNNDVDPYHAVVDTGCPKTVCGNPFMDAFIASKGDNFKVERKY